MCAVFQQFFFLMQPCLIFFFLNMHRANKIERGSQMAPRPDFGHGSFCIFLIRGSPRPPLGVTVPMASSKHSRRRPVYHSTAKSRAHRWDVFGQTSRQINAYLTKRHQREERKETREAFPGMLIPCLEMAAEASCSFPW